MNPEYRVYHPRWHRERLPIFWWLRKLSYTQFISRELTSVGVGYSAALILVLLWTASRGSAEAWARLQAWIASPPAIALHVFVLAILVYHTVTWLHLAPRALVVRLGDRRLPDAAIVAGHYAAWAAVSAVAAWLLTGRV